MAMLKKDEIDNLLSINRNDEDVQAYKNWLIGNKGKSEKQARLYSYSIGRLLRNCNGIRNDNDVWRATVLIYNNKLSKSYQCLTLLALELYLNFKGMKNTEGCFYKFKKPKRNPKVRKYLTKNEITQLIHQGARDKKDLALLLVLCKTGIRVNELSNLTVNDVDFDTNIITVRHGKGDKYRICPFDEQCNSVLKDYVAAYSIDLNEPTQLLFINRYRKKWSAEMIERCISRMGMDAGIKSKVTPHTIRHSFASLMLKGGCDIYTLKELMGHSRIATTELYLHDNPDERVAAYNNAMPKF